MTDRSPNDEPGNTFVLPDEPPQPGALAGAWSDLDWEEASDALGRIRHESEPTPPIHEL
jgi:hypothetical protein